MKLKKVVVKDVLIEMRKYRMGLIQTPGQLRFSYLAIIKGIQKAEFENGLPVGSDFNFYSSLLCENLNHKLLFIIY